MWYKNRILVLLGSSLLGLREREREAVKTQSDGVGSLLLEGRDPSSIEKEKGVSNNKSFRLVL